MVADARIGTPPAVRVMALVQTAAYTAALEAAKAAPNNTQAIDTAIAAANRSALMQLLDVPLLPEYPSAHSVLAATVAMLLQAGMAGAPMPVLATTSPTAPGVTRRWADLEVFMREVGEARVLEGVHFRSAVEVGTAMGRRIGALAAARLLPPRGCRSAVSE